MNSSQAHGSEAGEARKPCGLGAELDRLVEGELESVLAERDASTQPTPAATDPAERFVERAIAFLAGRDDRETLLARIRSALPQQTPSPESEKPDPNPE